MGIVLSKELKDSLVSVSITNDRVMSVKLGIGETVVNVICAYAPQVGCEDEEKERSGDRWFKSSGQYQKETG